VSHQSDQKWQKERQSGKRSEAKLGKGLEQMPALPLPSLLPRDPRFPSQIFTNASDFQNPDPIWKHYTRDDHPPLPVTSLSF